MRRPVRKVRRSCTAFRSVEPQLNSLDPPWREMEKAGQRFTMAPPQNSAGTGISTSGATVNPESKPHWPVVLAVIGIVVLGALWLRPRTPPPAPPEPPASNRPAGGELVEDALDRYYSQAGVALARVNNGAQPESAALPLLTEIDASLIFLKESFDSLPAPAKDKVRAVAHRQLNDFSLLADQVAGSQGTSVEFKAATQQLLSRLKGFAD